MARSMLEHMREIHGSNFCSLIVHYYPNSVFIHFLLEKGGEWSMFEGELFNELGEVFDKRLAEEWEFIQLKKVYGV